MSSPRPSSSLNSSRKGDGQDRSRDRGDTSCRWCWRWGARPRALVAPPFSPSPPAPKRRDCFVRAPGDVGGDHPSTMAVRESPAEIDLLFRAIRGGAAEHEVSPLKISLAYQPGTVTGGMGDNGLNSNHTSSCIEKMAW